MKIVCYPFDPHGGISMSLLHLDVHEGSSPSSTQHGKPNLTLPSSTASGADGWADCVGILPLKAGTDLPAPCFAKRNNNPPTSHPACCLLLLILLIHSRIGHLWRTKSSIRTVMSRAVRIFADTRTPRTPSMHHTMFAPFFVC